MSARASDLINQNSPVKRIPTQSTGKAGFSLIELLAVMMILAILMTFLAFQLGGMGETAKISLTKTFLTTVGGAANDFEHETGDYPPSAWNGEWGATPNKTNLGGETLCIALFSKDYTASGISEDELGNTDEDEAKKSLTSHANNSLFELKDGWDNPIAYFHRRNYGRSDVYLTWDEQGELADSEVKALKSPKTGNYYNPRGFQLISAGPDGIFGTDDDLYNFERVEESEGE